MTYDSPTPPSARSDSRGHGLAGSSRPSDSDTAPKSPTDRFIPEEVAQSVKTYQQPRRGHTGHTGQGTSLGDLRSQIYLDKSVWPLTKPSEAALFRHYVHNLAIWVRLPRFTPSLFPLPFPPLFLTTRRSAKRMSAESNLGNFSWTHATPVGRSKPSSPNAPGRAPSC